MDASLFSWAFVKDDEKFLQALENIDDIFSNDVSFAENTTDMFLDTKYNISFHGRTPKNELFDEEGNIKDEKKYQETLAELKSRLAHLKEKFKKDFESEEEKIYLKKIYIAENANDYKDIQSAKKIIIKLYEYLKSKIPTGKFKLIIIMENKYLDNEIKELENDHLFIRAVAFFAPCDATECGADNYGWQKIIKEFYSESIENIIEVERKELEERMKRLEDAHRKSMYENRKLRQLLAEKEVLSEEVWRGKQWLEEQYLNLIKLVEI